jgi:NTE family protein
VPISGKPEIGRRGTTELAKLRSYLDGLARWAALSPARRRPRKINLALQGGGAHGAFSWGVADQLLADERIEIVGLSGTSAGALNAVMIADGLARGGRAEARKRLAEFWRAASTGGNLPPMQRAVADRLFFLLPLAIAPLQDWFETMARYFSPYDLNPLNINPLKDVIERFVDFNAVRNGKVALFVAATNVHSGRIRIFSRETIDADAVMASAALPFLFQAVEIDKVPYWDGGYLSNPPIFPFLRANQAEDVVVVQINPVARTTTPKSSVEIVNRLNEITFNSALITELRTLDSVNRLIDDGHLPNGFGKGAFRRLNMHRIDLGTLATRLSASSKLKTDYQFFDLLRRAGQRTARRFLEQHFDDIGVRSTLDVATEAGVEWGDGLQRAVSVPITSPSPRRP